MYFVFCNSLFEKFNISLYYSNYKIYRKGSGKTKHTGKRKVFNSLDKARLCNCHCFPFYAKIVSVCKLILLENHQVISSCLLFFILFVDEKAIHIYILFYGVYVICMKAIILESIILNCLYICNTYKSGCCLNI